MLKAIFKAFTLNTFMKKYHIIYKTTNKLNGKFYIGKHSTDVIDDGYFGSGISLTRAIKKYGTENFTREILFIFENQNDMEIKEKELVNENLIHNKQSYNIALGGQGGNLGNLVNLKISKNTSKALLGKLKTEAHKEAIRKSKTLNPYNPTEDVKKRISHSVQKKWNELTTKERQTKFGFPGQSNPFYGKTHSNESLQKMRETIGDSRKGGKNANAKPITIDGVTYHTRKECLETLNITKRKLYKILGEL